MTHIVARFVPVMVAVVVGAPQVAAQTPPARFSHGVVFDVARGETVAFGGDAGNQNYLTDTWRRTTNGWSQGAAGLPAMETVAASYDRQRNVIVGVGGGGNAVQTWEYDGAAWTQRTGPAPAGRILHTLAYDEARNESVLFAGFNGFGNFADTWTWNGTAWNQRQPATSPPARRHHSMAYDRLRQRVVLFGGYSNSNTILGDTWEWDGVVWTQTNPTTSPPARYLHGMAWDGARGKVIAFGGTSQPFPASATLDDTWQYDGTTWSPVTSPLRPLGRLRIDHAMTFDETRQAVVLFGGRMGDSGALTGALSDTWELTATGWRPALNLVQSPVNGRLYALTPPMTWPQAEAFAVSIGGHLATVRSAAENAWLAQTLAAVGPVWIGYSDVVQEGAWTWASGEGTTFTNWPPSQPDNLNEQDYCLLFPGGTWDDQCPFGACTNRGIIELPGGPVAPFTATALPTSAPPPPLAATALAPLPTGGAVLFGGQTSVGPQFGTYELQGTAWTKRFSVLNPMVRTAHALALDGARQDVLLFGGRNPLGVALNDTWTWANGQWSYRQPANAPSPRSGHRLAYDPTAQTIELFGGVDAAGADLGDHWQWNGTTWAQRTPATLPQARRDHGLAFDARRQRLVLHGGASGAAVRDDVWEWNGTTWAQVTPQAPSSFPWAPTARAGHAFAYDPRAERVLLHGGADAAGACTADAWTWDGSAWTRLTTTSSAPSARRGSTAFFDPAANELRLFAGACGSGFANDLWRLDLPVFASSETYGQGCVGTLGVPTMAIEAPSRPLVGTTLNLRFTGVPGQFIPAIGAYGEQRDTYVGIPLPLDLGVVGLPGCTLWTSAEETFVLPAPNNTGSVLWAVAIPNDPLLLGTSSFFQGLAFELPGYPRWASMSNAVGVRIGNQ